MSRESADAHALLETYRAQIEQCEKLKVELDLIHDAISRTGIFCVNLLSSGDVDLARRFSSSEARDQRFEENPWVKLVTGAPALPATLASFDCEVTQVISVHSHTVFIGAVRDIRLWQRDVDALLYVDGQYGALASRAA